jgi:hypothetical protein
VLNIKKQKPIPINNVIRESWLACLPVGRWFVNRVSVREKSMAQSAWSIAQALNRKA